MRRAPDGRCALLVRPAAARVVAPRTTIAATVLGAGSLFAVGTRTGAFYFLKGCWCPNVNLIQ